eukprot:3001539-Prymnesium_polylepis.1
MCRRTKSRRQRARGGHARRESLSKPRGHSSGRRAFRRPLRPLPAPPIDTSASIDGRAPLHPDGVERAGGIQPLEAVPAEAVALRLDALGRGEDRVAQRVVVRERSRHGGHGQALLDGLEHEPSPAGRTLRHRLCDRRVEQEVGEGRLLLVRGADE